MSNLKNRDYLLMEILQCRPDELQIIDGIQYDWNEFFINDDITSVRECEFNNLIHTVLTYGLAQIEQSRNHLLQSVLMDIKEKYNDEIPKSIKGTISDLTGMDVQTDFTLYENYTDTHVYCVNNWDKYCTYLSNALDDFENNTGFNIEY